ncbi:DUF1830 domain-containing protein [Argonema antarcticum]|uniref:DUF1830 domain-containing protein n=1 Tax=Argonema antarcticum TaxID=2942763 RepID=UPI0020131457|nr:DUF1830 domain-containing protein [Argonema antarcticum]MCL1473493.1 DUF1830 domain-containing protein [Argonema antarcticum A004/B2]
MAQILDPLPPNSNNGILCCYVNATSKVQIARITNIPNWYFERVVFPGQRLVFETMVEGVLEIHTGMMASAILSDKISCDRLRLDEDPQQEVPPTQKQQEEKEKTPNREGIKKNVEITPSLTTLALVAVG